MSKAVLSPLAVLAGIFGMIALIAGTDIFHPVVKFIHNESITSLEALACLFFAIAGFSASYFLLNTICSYFVPRIKDSD